jgi:RNA polymerase sigma-70 factor (ECF subfamily)
MPQKIKQSRQINIDRELVIQALKGDEKAFAKLLLKYKDQVYHMMIKMVKNPNDAEDLTFEAFGKAFSNLAFYSSEYAFSTWLFKIATNNCIDFLRKQKGTTYSIDQAQEMDSVNGNNNGFKIKSNVPDPEERMILKQRGKILQGYLVKLKPHYQNLIDFRYFKEYSYEEIAKELDLPLGTVKVQLYRARNELFGLLEKYNLND